VAVSAPAAAQQPAKVVFGCDAPGHTCYFTSISEHGNRRTTFSIDGGRRKEIRDLVPGADVYMVAIDRPPPSYPELCGRQYPCKVAVVNAKYNN
jgi:hypothetical protein